MTTQKTITFRKFETILLSHEENGQIGMAIPSGSGLVDFDEVTHVVALLSPDEAEELIDEIKRFIKH